MHNMISQVSGNSPKNITESAKNQNLMNILRMLGDKKNSPNTIRPELSQGMRDVFQQLQTKKGPVQQKSGFNYSSILNNITN